MALKVPGKLCRIDTNDASAESQLSAEQTRASAIQGHTIDKHVQRPPRCNSTRHATGQERGDMDPEKNYITIIYGMEFLTKSTTRLQIHWK